MAHGRPAKRRRVSPPLDDSKISETIKASDLLDRAADWDLEQDYEQRSRKKNRKDKENTKLPIKTAEGRIERQKVTADSEDDADSFLDSASENDEPETPPTDDGDVESNIPISQQIVQAKEEIARLASMLNEDPEEHAGSFKKLAQIAGPNAHPSIQKLVLAAQAAVYKDVIPGYRIRAYKDEDLGTKVSKEIRQTRNYEQALVTGYQGYVKTLASFAKGRGNASDKSGLKTVALSCACTMLLSVPHFNFRTELLGILCRELASREPSPDFVKAVETIENYFQEDEDGAPSLEAVNLIAKMFKARDYRVREEVLNTFLHLRLLTELSAKSSTTRTDKREDDISKLHGRKVKKEKWEHRSKKQKKVARENKSIEKEMREASAQVDYEAREKMQSETLKVVFVVYFRILKARIPPLMGAVLEGLAKYAHLINQDFFGDILEALKDIISQAEASIIGESLDEQDSDETDDNPTQNPDDEDEETHNPATLRNHTRESLLSTQTAFTLLSQQEVSKSASSLHLDLSFFTSHIYRSLPTLTLSPDIELGPKSLHLLDPHIPRSSPSQSQALDRAKINISTPILLLIRALTSILLTPSGPSATPSSQVLATFLKRLLSSTLQTPEKSSLAILTLVSRIVGKHAKKVEALWYSDERKGDGVYRGDAESIAGTNVFSVGSGVWEGELLKKHWAPGVRDQWKGIEAVVRDLGR